MTLKEIMEEIYTGKVKGQRVVELEKQLVEIDFDNRIQSARDWARNAMISREKLNAVEFDLQLEKVRALRELETVN